MAKAQTTNPTYAQYNKRWAGDFLNREHLIPGPFRLDAAQFPATGVGALTISVGAGGAAAAATSVPVAITGGGTLPVGTVLRFGDGKYARTTAEATSATTSLAVEALAAALVADDTANYSPTGNAHVPSGTIVGRTQAEADAKTGFGPAASTDDFIYIVAFDVVDASDNPDCEMYRPNSQVKTNFLPVWDSLAAALQTAVRSRYICTTGQP